MARIARRRVLKLSAAGGFAGILASGRGPALAQETTIHWLRWADFVPASDTLLKGPITQECKKALGFNLKVETVNANDLQSRITSAIQSGTGADIIMAFGNWPQLYADSLADAGDVANEIASAQGGYYDISMMDCQVSMLTYQAAYYLMSGEVPGLQGRGHRSLTTYRAYLCGDGIEIVVAANSEKMWENLCAVCGLPDLPRDPRFCNRQNRLENRADAHLPVPTIFEIHRQKANAPATDAWYVSQVGGGDGIDPSQVLKVRPAGSSDIRRCRNVVPLRGRPVMNRGRASGTSRISGCLVRSAWTFRRLTSRETT